MRKNTLFAAICAAHLVGGYVFGRALFVLIHDIPTLIATLCVIVMVFYTAILLIAFTE